MVSATDSGFIRTVTLSITEAKTKPLNGKGNSKQSLPKSKNVNSQWEIFYVQKDPLKAKGCHFGTELGQIELTHANTVTQFSHKPLL